DHVPTSLVHDRYKLGEGYHVVPPPYTGTFIPPKPDLVFHDAPNASEKVPNVLNGNPHEALKDKGVIDSGCSRHMTRNICYLSDSEEIHGGYVAFGRNPKGDKITSKGTVGNDIESVQQYVLPPLWSTGSKDSQNTDADDAFNVKENKSEVHVSPSSSDKPKKHAKKDKREDKGKSPVDLSTGVRDLNMPTLEDIVYSDDEEDVGVEADFSNLEISITVSPIPTTRLHKDHLVTQIIGVLSLALQTRSMTRMVKEQGLQVKQKDDGIFISQDKYIAKILRKFGLTDGKSASTPIDTEKPLLKDPDGEDVIHMSMIGSLMYLSSSKPDIMFVLCDSPFNLVAYSNSDYARASLDRKSTTGVASPNRLEEEIFTKLARIGYEKPSTKLTFYKAFFSAQWKFLIHKIVQCMSAKRTAWNEFISSMASVVICLATGRKFKFSKYIFDSMVRNMDSTSKFLMYPRFLQVMINAQVYDISSHNTKYTSPVLTQKVFANIRRIGKGFSGVDTPLFDAMLVQQQVQDHDAEVEEDEDDQESAAPTPPSPTPATTPPPPQQEPISSPPQAQSAQPSSPPQQQPSQTADISESLMTLLNTLMETHTDEVEPAEVEEVLEVITAAKLMTEVVTTTVPITTAAQVTKDSAPRRRRGVLIQDPEETASASIDMDEVFARQLEGELNANINWNDVIEKVKRGEKQDNTVIRFKSTEPKNFSDNFLLNILKIMFEKPNVEANVWRDQKGRHGLAKVKSWKLLESCGVHIITLTTTQVFMPIDKKYPLTHFTREQMLNNVRLEVEEESEMSLKLLRLVRRQLNEGYVLE
nr:hypothetical protein [Tanacetum cinerariifolium]GEY17409.1 hypothetical protein [Tanacetum cinerariifolium]